MCSDQKKISHHMIGNKVLSIAKLVQLKDSITNRVATKIFWLPRLGD
jgi:hypothetical protein